MNTLFVLKALMKDFRSIYDLSKTAEIEIDLSDPDRVTLSSGRWRKTYVNAII